MARKQVRTNEEIAKEKAEMAKLYSEMDALEVAEEQENKGSRYYSREFKKVYNGVRKALIVLEKQRKYKVITNEEAYNKALILLDKFNV